MVGLPRSGEAGCPWTDARAFFDWSRVAGYAAVQLDGTLAGLRARELDASARRDIAASLARRGLSLSGIDLFIPSGDFADPARVDRAVSAIVAGMELMADLRSVCAGDAGVSALLPSQLEATTRSELVRQGQRLGVALVDFAWKSEHAGTPGGGVIVQGIDPAIAGATEGTGKANEAISSLIGASATTGRIGAARLSETSGIGRIEVGADPSSRLDVLAYAATLAAAKFRGTLVWDARGLPKPVEAAHRGPATYAKLLGPLAGVQGSAGGRRA
jgi:hypothetical protein